MADRPLRPATHRRLGGPLPRLLPNGPRPHPAPSELSSVAHARLGEYPVLAAVSGGCPGVRGRLVTCYSPVRHCMSAPKGGLTVRLACVRHAASVHPEPGSNSPFEMEELDIQASSSVSSCKKRRGNLSQFKTSVWHARWDLPPKRSIPSVSGSQGASHAR